MAGTSPTKTTFDSTLLKNDLVRQQPLLNRSSVAA